MPQLLTIKMQRFVNSYKQKNTKFLIKGTLFVDYVPSKWARHVNYNIYSDGDVWKMSYSGWLKLEIRKELIEIVSSELQLQQKFLGLRGSCRWIRFMYCREFVLKARRISLIVFNRTFMMKKDLIHMIGR